MKMKTCNDLYQTLKKHKLSLFFALEGHTWFEQYLYNQEWLDRFYLSNIYRDIVVDDDLAFDEKTTFQDVFDMTRYMSLTMSAFEEIDKIYEVLFQKSYDPLWNVDGMETETHSGTDTHKFNNVNDNKSISGSIKDEKSGTDNVVNTGTTTSNHSVNPNLNTQSMVNAYRDTTELDEVTAKQTFGSANTKTFSGYNEENLKTGSEDDIHGHKIVTERHGNIGVTSTQNLITQEVQLRNKRFWDYVFGLWAQWFTQGIYKSKDCDWRCCEWF